MAQTASLKKRLYASYVDLVIYVMLAYIIGGAASLLKLYTDASYNIFALITFLLFISYDIYTVYTYQATLGKRMFGLKVENKNGKRPSFRTVLLRETIGKGLSLLPLGLGVWWILLNKEKEAWHDKLTHTRVIDTRST